MYELPTLPDLWRSLGFQHGAAMVDVLTSCIDRDLLVRDGISAYLEPGVRLPVTLRRLIAMECLPPSNSIENMVHRDYVLDEIRKHDRALRASLVDLAAPLSGNRRSRRSYPVDDSVVAAIRNFLKSQPKVLCP